MGSLLVVRGKYSHNYKKMRLTTGAHAETRYGITSILKVG